jgi:hypothetical protein
MTDTSATTYRSTITCPGCGHKKTETMPTKECVIGYDCEGCGTRLVPTPGSCCVFCSHGDVPCPPKLEGRSCG